METSQITLDCPTIPEAIASEKKSEIKKLAGGIAVTALLIL